jgi:hypothetical protein
MEISRSSWYLPTVSRKGKTRGAAAGFAEWQGDADTLPESGALR